MPSRWAVTRPEHVVAWLDRQHPWWFAGGWAIELFLGAAIREHSDLEVGCFRDSANQLIAQLTSALGPLEVVAAKHKVLTPITDVAAVPDDHQALWLRRCGEPLWLLEVLLEQRVAERWQFRRDPRISRACDSLVRRTASGVPFLAPEVQLLYKAKEPRAKDEHDFTACCGALDEPARAWLAASLAVTQPGHPWIARLG